MFNRAIAERKLDVNPLRGLKPPAWAKTDTQERRAFTRDELQIIFTQFPGEWRDMVAACLLLGGQRLGDIATLRWSQFDLEHGIVRIIPHKTPKNMVKPIVPALRALLDRRHSGMAGQTNFVFPYAAARYGQAGDKSSKLSIEFKNLLIKYGLLHQEEQQAMRAKNGHRIPEISYHSLRTTATTLLLDMGTPGEMVRRIIGHDDAEIERRHYYRPTIDGEAHWVNQLASLIGYSSANTVE